MAAKMREVPAKRGTVPSLSHPPGLLSSPRRVRPGRAADSGRPQHRLARGREPRPVGSPAPQQRGPGVPRPRRCGRGVAGPCSACRGNGCFPYTGTTGPARPRSSLAPTAAWIFPEPEDPWRVLGLPWPDPFLAAMGSDPLPVALLQAAMLTAISAALVLCGSAVLGRINAPTHRQRRSPPKVRLGNSAGGHDGQALDRGARVSVARRAPGQRRSAAEPDASRWVSTIRQLSRQRASR